MPDMPANQRAEGEAGSVERSARESRVTMSEQDRTVSALERLLVKLRFQEGTFSVQEQCDFRAALESAIDRLTDPPLPGGAPAPTAQELHRCSGCGHRWDGPLKGAELCGDCWRIGQPVIHQQASSPVRSSQPSGAALAALVEEWRKLAAKRWVTIDNQREHLLPVDGRSVYRMCADELSSLLQGEG